MNAAAPIRVTELVFDLDGGGLESLVGAMARRWHNSPVTVSIITLGGRVGRVGETVRSLVDQYIVLKPSRLSMVAPLGVAAAIRRTRPDVVHLHSGAWYKGALASRLAGVPRVVYTEHGREHYDPALMQRLDRLASRWTPVVVAVSDRLNAYLSRLVGIDARRIVTVPNGVDATRFTPGEASAALRAALALPKDALVLGSVGRLEAVKASHRMIEALAALRRARPELPAFLVLFGDGSEKAALQASAERLGVAEYVRLPGWADAVDAHRLIDAFALTSISEGASVSLMEAMACGAAPVVMDVGANAEILGPALKDQVVPAGDVTAFADVVARTLGDAARRAAIGVQARARVVERYTFEGMVAGYERLFRFGIVR